MILAIDPGTSRTGWVLINDGAHPPRPEPIESGLCDPREMRDVVIQNYMADVIVIEKPV